MEAGGSQGRVNLTTFSLTELSLLMKILDEIHLPEIYFSSESSFENVFRQKGGQVIARIGLAVDDRMVIDFRLKIRAVSKAIEEVCLIHTQYRAENSGI